jgi:hypothetical protein
VTGFVPPEGLEVNTLSSLFHAAFGADARSKQHHRIDFQPRSLAEDHTAESQE